MKGQIGVPMKAFAIFGRIPNYWRWLNMLSSLRHFSQSEIAQRRHADKDPKIAIAMKLNPDAECA
jgi:hypothetical protein